MTKDFETANDIEVLFKRKDNEDDKLPVETVVGVIVVDELLLLMFTETAECFLLPLGHLKVFRGNFCVDFLFFHF